MKNLLLPVMLLIFGSVGQPWLYAQPLQMSGTVVDAATQAPLMFANLTVKGYALGTATDENGAFQLAIDPSHFQDSLIVSMVGYTNTSWAIADLRRRSFSMTFALQSTSFEFVAVEVGAPMVLRNIQFEFNKHKLLPPSFPELSKLFNYLIKNPQYNIEIIGHTDDVGSDTYNLALSEARAGAVLSWLEEAGIPASRMIARGYGEQYPIATNDTELGREQNRRVEFRVFDHPLEEVPPYQVVSSDARSQSPTIDPAPPTIAAQPDTPRVEKKAPATLPVIGAPTPSADLIGTPKGIDKPNAKPTPLAAQPNQAQAQLHAAVLKAQFERHRVAGAMRIVAEGETLLEAASGMADYTYHAPLTTEHKFYIGTLAESFTAVLLLRLTDAQKLDLDAPLGTFFPDFPDVAIRERVTVWQLLTHTSGLRDTDGLDIHRLNERQKWNAFQSIQATGRQTPGAYHHAAINYYLAASIAEEVTQLDFFELLKREIFQPLQMAHTAPIDLTALDSLRTRHYLHDGAALSQVPLHAGLFTPGHNGLVSTLDDLTRWEAALRRGQLLSEARFQLLTRPFIDHKTLLGDLGPSGQLTHYSAQHGTEVGFIYAPHSSTFLLSNVQGTDLTPLLPLTQ